MIQKKKRKQDHKNNKDNNINDTFSMSMTSSSFNNKSFKNAKNYNVNLTNPNNICISKKANEIQFDSFRKQLKTALLPKKLGRQTDRKYEFNKKLNKKQGQQQQKTSRKPLLTNRTCHFNTYIPQRIARQQNSSILQNITFHNNQNSSFSNSNIKNNKNNNKKHNDSSNKKCLMRKQKFNQFFNLRDFKLNNTLRHTLHSQQSKQHNTKSILFGNQLSSLMGGKINYQNFKNISNHLKLQNQNLDKIRIQCNLHGNKQNQNVDTHQIIQVYQKSLRLQRQLQKYTLQQTHLNKDKQDNNDQTLQMRNTSTLNNVSNNENNNQTIIITKKQLNHDKIDKNEQNLLNSSQHQPQKLKKATLIQQKQAVELQKHLLQQNKSNQININILRNDLNTNTKQSDEIKKSKKFTNNSISNSCQKINTRYKLQKYKSDYRRFMKIQLLDRIKDAVN